MLKTIDGKTIDKVVKEFRESEKNEGLTFSEIVGLDGATSAYVGHEGDIVSMKIDDIYVLLTFGENSIKLPNYGHYMTLSHMIEDAAEILLFEKGMKVD